MHQNPVECTVCCRHFQSRCSIELTHPSGIQELLKVKCSLWTCSVEIFIFCTHSHTVESDVECSVSDSLIWQLSPYKCASVSESLWSTTITLVETPSWEPCHRSSVAVKLSFSRGLLAGIVFISYKLACELPSSDARLTGAGCVQCATHSAGLEAGCR